MSKVEKEHVSENEDDPAVYESSGDEWDKSEEKKKRGNRRASQRLSKKPRVTVVQSSSSEEEVEDEEDEEVEDSEEDDEFSEEESSKKKSKNGVNKKQKVTSTTNSGAVTTTANSNSGSKNTIHRKFIPKTIYSDDFGTGSFVISKKDAQVGDASKHPCIWRIDGKALLQKYEAFDEDGKVRHRNTSVYTGWSPLDKDQYAPVTVDVIQHNNQNLIVELHWDKLKEINQDSD